MAYLLHGLEYFSPTEKDQDPVPGWCEGRGDQGADGRDPDLLAQHTHSTVGPQGLEYPSREDRPKAVSLLVRLGRS